MFCNCTSVYEFQKTNMAQARNAMCQPCKRTNENVTATHHCHDCCEHLCPSCLEYHMKFKHTMNHDVTDISAITKSNTSLELITNLGLCSQHKGKKLDFYCMEQDILCCKRCVSKDHKYCKVVPVKDHVESLKEGEDEKEAVKEKLAGLQTYVETVTSHFEESLDVLKTSKEEAPAKVQQLKDKISRAMEDIEKRADEESLELYEKEKSVISQRLETSKSILSNTKELQNFLTTTSGNGDKTKMFMTCHALKKEAESHERIVQDMQSSCTTNVCVDVEVDNNVDELIKQLDRAVHVRTIRAESTVNFPYPKPFRNRQAQTEGQFSVKSPEDNKPCRITGTCFLQDGRVIIADETNHSVKVFDTSYVFVTEMMFSGKPGSLAKTGPTEIAVTFRGETKVHFLSVNNFAILEKSVIDCRVDCYGVVNRNEREIIVSYNSGPGLVVAKKDGSSVYQVKLDSELARQLRYPFGLTYQESKDVVYVTSASLCCVTGLRVTSGEVLFQYSAPSLKWCLGVALDVDKNVYVCGHSSGNVLQISPHGALLKVLLSDGQGIKQPQHINFCPDGETFLLADDADRNTLKIFKLV